MRLGGGREERRREGEEGEEREGGREGITKRGFMCSEGKTKSGATSAEE